MNLARNWARWGRPSGPRVGAVVVWPHHVGMITGQTADGRWIVRPGNDGGRVRERPRSVSHLTTHGEALVAECERGFFLR
jgi:hypothetical protein